MMHKAWCSIEEVPYCFPRPSIKFQGHKGQKIDDLDQIWARLLGRSQLSNPSDLPCSSLQTCTQILKQLPLKQSGFELNISKIRSWNHMGRIENMIIKNFNFIRQMCSPLENSMYQQQWYWLNPPEIFLSELRRVKHKAARKQSNPCRSSCFHEWKHSTDETIEEFTCWVYNHNTMTWKGFLHYWPFECRESTGYLWSPLTKDQ